ISLSSLTVEDLYEKAATMPLIRTVENAKSLATMTSLSNSCPDLHDETQRFITLSSSLPQKLEFKPVFNNNPRITAEDILLQPHISRKIPPAKFDNDFGVGNPDRPLLNFVFVDSKHPEFETKYSKKNCIIDGEFSGIDVAMNRRSWTMLLDFFGVLGVKTEKSEDEPDQISLSGIDEKYLELLYGKDAANDIKIQNELSNAKLLTQNATTNAQKKEDYLMHLNLTVGTGRIFMTYPKNQTQLGMLISNSLELDVKINVANPLEPLLMKILTTELFLHDTTPFYSRFYSERMSLKPRDHQESKNHSKIEIDILKYRTNDPYLKRDCDMKMKIIST
uniref:Uncharacterized protein n=1 Tax=Panagrolaimus sp. JU765 TaxID=591449 RepID=A0AC34R7N8_9BILA